MTERPILFSPASVQAILAGTKTQTRRVLRPQPDVLRAEVSPTGAPTLAVQWRGTRWESSGGRAVTLANLWESWAAWRCPYGISALYQDPPDRLWVREKWATLSEQPRTVVYAADGQYGAWLGDGAGGNVFLPHGWVQGVAAGRNEQRGWWVGRELFGPWRSPLHMPRWASRITLEIVAVRVERLQEITDAEASAEGIRDRQAFAREWDALNAGRGFAWERNPWVWAITFRRTE